MAGVSYQIHRQMIDGATVHYPPVLPYHDWEHARDVMDQTHNLVDASFRPDIKSSRELLVVAAAWHDADYALPLPEGQGTKEERSARLVGEKLVYLSEKDRQFVKDAILDTTVETWPKRSSAGALLHFADVGYMAHQEAGYFMKRFLPMHEEWESPSRQESYNRTRAFGEVLIAEAEEVMPDFLPEYAWRGWTNQVKRNIEYLRTDWL